jgi:hypothetical protein
MSWVKQTNEVHMKREKKPQYNRAELRKEYQAGEDLFFRCITAVILLSAILLILLEVNETPR